MSNIIITYSIYLIVTLSVTIWVANTLFKNGKVFLIDIFHGNKELADSVNNLLVVGFYLINIGYAVFTLKLTNNITNAQEIIENLSFKIGLIILILGGMHFLICTYFLRFVKEQCLKKRWYKIQGYNLYYNCVAFHFKGNIIYY